MLIWLIPTIVAVWTAVALVVVSLCAAAARADSHLRPRPGRERAN